MVASKQPAARKAMTEAIANARDLRRTYDKVWNAAKHAPMFYKEYTKETKDDKGKAKRSIVRRTARLINGHAYQIAAAGAASAAIREMRTECANLGIDYTATTGSPCLPVLADGTKLVIEQFLSAYIQEAVLVATQGMKTIGKHQRLNGKAMKAAFDEVNEQIFTAAGPAPRSVVVVPLKAAKKKAAAAEGDEGGGDFEATGEVDEAADEAAIEGGEGAAEED